METKKVLGVDIGNVIINSRLRDPEVTKVDEAIFAAFPPVDGVFDVLKTLTSHFNGEVYLISRCTEWAEEQILSWLKTHNFYTKTGVDPKNVYFVRERHEKDGICRNLGITHFIDDRLEVLGHMIESTPNLILFNPDDAEVKEFEQFLPKVSVANNWADVVIKITK